jgi:hypothetical protein
MYGIISSYRHAQINLMKKPTKSPLSRNRNLNSFRELPAVKKLRHYVLDLGGMNKSSASIEQALIPRVRYLDGRYWAT